MGSFGERLRREREMRKVTLDEMAAATKIGTRSLKALEDEQFSKLPGGIFNKGFVRAYAKFLGINEEQAVADYLAAAGEEEESAPEIDVTQLAAHVESEKKARAKELESINDSKTGIPWAAIAALMVIVAAVGGGWQVYTRYRVKMDAKAATEQAQRATEQQRQQELQRQAELTSQQAVQQSAPAASAQDTQDVNKISDVPPSSLSTSMQGSASSSSDGDFVLLIRAKQDSWVSVKADGKSIMSGMLSASSEKAVHGHGKLTFRTGNAGGVELAVNGKVMPSIGRESEVRTVVVTPEGIQQ